MNKEFPSPNDILERFTSVTKEEINLQFLFDHVGHYIIAGVVLFGSAFVRSDQSPFGLHTWISAAVGYSLFVVGLLLYWLNLLQGIKALRVITHGRLGPFAYAMYGLLSGAIFLGVVLAPVN